MMAMEYSMAFICMKGRRGDLVDKEQNERKEFLQEQLEWTKEQIYILDQMDRKLQEMKRIAEHAVGNDLSMDEREGSNRCLGILKHEYSLLEEQKKIVLY